MAPVAAWRRAGSVRLRSSSTSPPARVSAQVRAPVRGLPPASAAITECQAHDIATSLTRRRWPRSASSSRQSPVAAATASGSSSARPSSSISRRVGRRASASGTASPSSSKSIARTEEVPRSRASTRRSSTAFPPLPALPALLAGTTTTQALSQEVTQALSQEVGCVRRLVLWDVDGTLVLFGGLGRQAFADAFVTIAGRPASGVALAVIETAGRTDPEIALEFLAMHGIADGEARLDAFNAALVEALAAKATLLREHGRALPGVEQALAAVQRRPGVVQSLLTGNLEANAVLKLGTFGLDRYIDFEVGAYGSDHRDRPRLVEV